MIAKIKDISIIVDPLYKQNYINLLGDGKKFGIKIKYYEQKNLMDYQKHFCLLKII